MNNGELVKLINREVQILGASIEFVNRKKHLMGVISVNGNKRKIFISSTPSCYHSRGNTLSLVRRYVREMSK